MLRNPPEAPSQTYAWQVLNDLSVVGFLDLVKTRRGDGLVFAGALAPVACLSLSDDEARLLRRASAGGELEEPL